STKSIIESNGAVTFQMTMVKAGTHTISAADISGTHSAWSTSLSSTLTVNASTATHLLLLMPGENPLPGTAAPGKTGGVTPQVAGASFTVTVEIVDDYFNPQPKHNLE